MENCTSWVAPEAKAAVITLEKVSPLETDLSPPFEREKSKVVLEDGGVAVVVEGGGVVEVGCSAEAAAETISTSQFSADQPSCVWFLS